jgi:hypothetical protein
MSFELNDVMRVNKWYVSGNSRSTNSNGFNERAGYWPFRISYRKYSYITTAKLLWRLPGEGDYSVVPEEYFFLDDYPVEELRKCKKPAGWCQPPAVYTEQDCDGDGIADPTCYTPTSFAVIQSSLN